MSEADKAKLVELWSERAMLRKLAEERREAYQRVAATGNAADVRRMEEIEDEVFRILLSPAAPSAQAKPTGEGDTLGVARARELRKRIITTKDYIDGNFYLKAVVEELDRLFPGVVAEDKQG